MRTTNGGEPPQNNLSLHDESNQNPTDHDLLGMMVQGDADALRELMSRYDKLVRYTIFRTSQERCKQEPDWLDARASETWTGFVQSMKRSKDKWPANLATYLTQTARNTCISALRIGQALSSKTISESEANLTQLPEEKEDTPEIISRMEQLESLRGCMGGLDIEDKAICRELDLLMAKRWKEASEKLEIPESTLRSRWGRIIDQLRSCLEKKIPEK